MKNLVRYQMALLVLLLAGCANQTSIWRNEQASGNVVGMDAQQRVVLSNVTNEYVSTPRESTTTAGGTITKYDTHLRSVVQYCPEPSPDAIASFAAAFAAGASKTTGADSTDAKVNSAVATTVAAVGLRTPTTQVIRDLLTAACIGQMNGSFDNEFFREAFARNQQFVLAAHAIAVIGGESAAGQPTVAGMSGTSGLDPSGTFKDYRAAQAARQAAEAKANTAKAEQDAADSAAITAKAELDSAEKADPPKETDIAAAKKTVTEKDELAAAKKKFAIAAAKAVDDARVLEMAAARASTAAASFASATAAGTATPGTVLTPSREKLSDKAIAEIGKITSQVLQQGFTLDKCLSQLMVVNNPKNTLDAPSKKQLTSSILEYCGAVVKTQTEIQTKILSDMKAMR